jgi:folate-binding protein YgfZ
MHEIWSSALKRAGAVIPSNATTISDFGQPSAELLAAKEGNIVSDLSQYRVLRISGDDAQLFLNNLLSSDIRKLQSGDCQYSTFSTPKGRMLASMIVIRTALEYLLILPFSLAEAIQRKLSMYVLRSKVKITAQADDEVLLGIAGNQAKESLRQLLGTALTVSMSASFGEDHTAIDLGNSCIIVLTSPQTAANTFNSLMEMGFIPAGADAWNWRWIQLGFAWIYPETQEQFVAQMANMECIGAVSFTKGCYPGQEIVARTQYLGKLKRRLYLVHIDSNLSDVQRGTHVYSPELPGQAIGTIADVANAPGGGLDALAVIQSSCWEHGVMLDAQNGPPLEAKPLPYSIEQTQ